jgi:hypothetical protein
MRKLQLEVPDEYQLKPMDIEIVTLYEIVYFLHTDHSLKTPNIKCYNSGTGYSSDFVFELNDPGRMIVTSIDNLVLCYNLTKGCAQIFDLKAKFPNLALRTIYSELLGSICQADSIFMRHASRDYFTANSALYKVKLNIDIMVDAMTDNTPPLEFLEFLLRRRKSSSSSLRIKLLHDCIESGKGIATWRLMFDALIEDLMSSSPEVGHFRSLSRADISIRTSGIIRSSSSDSVSMLNRAKSRGPSANPQERSIMAFQNEVIAKV